MCDAHLEHFSECSRPSIADVIGTEVEGVYSGIPCHRHSNRDSQDGSRTFLRGVFKSIGLSNFLTATHLGR